MNNMALQTRLLLCALALLLLTQAAVAADLSGKWNIVFDTSNGEYEFPLTLTVKGENVAATIDGQEMKGTFRGGKLELAGEFFPAVAGYKAELKISGQTEGDQIKGDASWDVYEMTFTATRAE